MSLPRRLQALPDRLWSAEDWDLLHAGYRARDMDEKWNVFTEADVLFLHRSWTGRRVYEVRFGRAAEGSDRLITQAAVEGDTERYRAAEDEYECVVLELVLSAIVLGEPANELREKLVALTRGKPGAANVPAGAVLQSVLGQRSDS